MTLVQGRASWILCLTLALFSQISLAQEFPSDTSTEEEVSIEDLGPALAEPEANPRQYYTFDEKQGQAAEHWSSPQALLQETLSLIADSDTLSLLRWILHDSPPPAPGEPYKRNTHFGTWRGDPSGDTCYNTRARVLIRDSRGNVTFSSKNHCLVESGLWKDPYTGSLIESARQIQIDHVVPLKNAYISGASRWTPQARCTYANFEANPEHLMAVSGRENMRKGDRTPAEYLPPDETYICSYLQKWMGIKLTWRMFMSDEEVSAIIATMKEHHCSNADMSLSKRDILHWRQEMQEYGPCANFGH